MEKKQVIILYYSKYQHLAAIAQAVAKGVAAAGVDVRLMNPEEASAQMEALDQADGIIFGSPTYFGSMAAELKAFFEKTGQRFASHRWRNKIAAGFSHSGSLSGDKLNTLFEMMVFALQHGMLWVGMDMLTNEVLADDLADRLGLPHGAKVNRLGSWTGLMTSMAASADSATDLLDEDLHSATYMGYRVGKVVHGLTPIQ